MTELRKLFFPYAPGSKTLVIFLPGAYHRAIDFAENDFVEMLHRRRIAADVVAADVSEEIYGLERDFLDLLRAQIVAPAQQRGYDHIWLVGISIGGYAAMAYTATFPSDVRGVLAIAPYLSRRVLKEIGDHGGLPEWARSYRDSGRRDLPRDVWHWLADGPTGHVHLCFGDGDRFADAHRLAATVLGTRTFSQDGGHDWPTWRRLWDSWLDLDHIAAPAFEESGRE